MKRKGAAADPAIGMAAVRALRAEMDDPLVTAGLRLALAHPHGAVVALAAELAAERELTGLRGALAEAWERLYENAEAVDPSCAGKTACATALDTLNHADREPFVNGAHYFQMQPVWGGLADVSSGLRARCVLALARFGGVEALMVIAEALADSAEAVRGAAAQSLAYCGEAAAAAMALQKICSGDRDPAVTADALGALITLRPHDGLQCADKLLKGASEALRPFVLVAVGQSRQPEALPTLTRQLSTSILASDRRDVFVAIGLLRTPNSTDFLMETVKTGPLGDARVAIAALAMQSQADSMRAAVVAAAVGRSLETAIREAFG